MLWIYRDPAVATVVTALAAIPASVLPALAVGGPGGLILLGIGGFFAVIAVLGIVLLVLERWVGGSSVVERLPDWLVPFLRKDAIEIVYRPDPDHWVHLYVRNNRPPGKFSAQVTNGAGAEKLQTFPWDVKWRGHPGQWREIGNGSEWPLDLAQATPPVENPHGAQGAWKRGEFILFSVSQPDGWPVTPGPSEIIGPVTGIKWLGERRVYHEALTLRLEVTRRGRNPIVKRATLGFNPPFHAELRDDNVLVITPVANPVRVEIEDW